MASPAVIAFWFFIALFFASLIGLGVIISLDVGSDNWVDLFLWGIIIGFGGFLLTGFVLLTEKISPVGETYRSGAFVPGPVPREPIRANWLRPKYSDQVVKYSDQLIQPGIKPTRPSKSEEEARRRRV